MGVENSPSGAIGAGVAGSVAARGFSSIVNEGPFRGSLEGFRPMNASDINTIDKGGTIAPNRPSVVEQAEAVAAKAWEASEPLVPAEVVSQAQVLISQAQTKTVWMTDHFTQPKSVVIAQAEPMVLPWVEPAPALQVSPSPLPQPLLKEQEVEEIVTEKITKEETGMVEEEEIEKIRRKYVVDERALSQVVVEFKAAVRKARELAGKLGIKITGKLISKFLPGQHPGNESEAVKGKSPDGSIPDRQQSVEELGELSLDTQAEDKVVKVAYEKPPIKIRSEGEQVRDVDIQRVYQYHLTKPKPVTEVVVRIVKKKKLISQSGQEAVETPVWTQVSENKIEDYPDLAEVFKH